MVDPKTNLIRIYIYIYIYVVENLPIRFTIIAQQTPQRVTRVQNRVRQTNMRNVAQALIKVSAV